MDGGDWADPNARALAIYLDGRDDPDQAEDGTPLLDDDFLVLVNSWWEPLGFTLPPTRPGAEWHADIDSYDPAAPAGAAKRHAGDQVTVGPRSVAVFRATPLPRPQLRSAAQPSRCSRWSPTRTALAIAVRAGLTALMLGKKLVSTT